MAEDLDILLRFGYDAARGGRQTVVCPFHDDRSPSLSIGPEYVKCFGSCARSWSLEEASDLLDSPEEAAGMPQEVGDDAPLSVEELVELVTHDSGPEEYLESRGISREALAHAQVTATNGDGWLTLTDRYGTQQRRAPVGTEQRFDSTNARSLFWVSEKAPPRSRVWLVEGPIDALSLAELLPSEYIAATLGSTPGANRLYPLRDRLSLILYDSDAAGFTGAKKVAKTVREFGGRAVVVEAPEDMGKDPNDGLSQHREEYGRWLDQVIRQYGRDDTAYVRGYFRDGEPQLKVSSTIPAWDGKLRGGFRPGLHAIGAAPKVGKTALTLQIVDEAAGRGLRCLVVEYEISKAQTWARLASRHIDLDWDAIEASPAVVSAFDAYESAVLPRAEKIRVATNWSVDQITHAAPDFDVIVVDYLQRMPGAEGRYDRVTQNVEGLSNLGRDYGIVVLCVSSLNRAGYGDMVTMADFKESGAIEYVSQSVTGLTRAENSDTVFANVVANTRGPSGPFRMKADLGSQRFLGE